MSDELPQGWVKTTLGEICTPVGTIRPDDEPTAMFSYFDIGSIDGEQNRITATKIVTGQSAPSRARQAVQNGDILFSTVRTYLRNIARIDEEYSNPVASTGFAVIRVAPGVSGAFVFQQVISEPFLQPLHALQSGSSYPAVRDRDVFSQPIVLPPSAEQERIVSKLEAILSRISAGEAAAKRALARLQRYRVAVLHAAVTGELTREWRKTNSKPAETGAAFLRRLLDSRRSRWEEVAIARQAKSGKLPSDSKWKGHYLHPSKPNITDLPKLPSRWAWASLDELSWSSGYGTSVKCSPDADGPAILRIPNVRDGQIDFANIKFATRTTEIGDNDYVTPGDFLIIRTNGSRDLIGRAALAIEPPQQQCSFASYLIRYRLVGDVALWKWLSFGWKSALIRERIESRAATTAGQYNVSLSSLGDIAVPLPPADEHQEIVRQVEQRLANADRLSSSLEKALTRARVWRQSVLNAAFTGCLIPQSRDDEPASLLLEKIQAARMLLAAQPKPKRDSGGRRKRMKPTRRNILQVLEETKKPMKPEDLFNAAGFDEASVENFFSELKDLNARKRIREKRDPQDRSFVRLEVRT
jgi:type I restriction enzyme S subunit